MAADPSQLQMSITRYLRSSASEELPYVQTLQLSLATFKDSVALQCSYDGALVRFLAQEMHTAHARI